MCVFVCVFDAHFQNKALQPTVLTLMFACKLFWISHSAQHKAYTLFMININQTAFEDYLSIHLSIYLSFYPCVRPSVHPSIYPFIHSSKFSRGSFFYGNGKHILRIRQCCISKLNTNTTRMSSVKTSKFGFPNFNFYYFINPICVQMHISVCAYAQNFYH